MFQAGENAKAQQNPTPVSRMSIQEAGSSHVRLGIEHVHCMPYWGCALGLGISVEGSCRVLRGLQGCIKAYMPCSVLKGFGRTDFGAWICGFLRAS